MRILESVQLGLLAGAVSLGWGPAREQTPGTVYQVPYQLTHTNHYLVRVRVNGKGPFNFLVDTGAPALYVGTKTAEQIGLQPSKTSYWTSLDRIEIEGGADLRNLKARIEDPFQLTGMNALGLPGASIDGILGFTVLARFRMEFDPTRDRLRWTLLDYQPPDPPTPRAGREREVPPELQFMNMLAPLAKVFAGLAGKQPEDQIEPRGYLGLELKPHTEPLQIRTVLEGSPAARAGIQPGDRLVRVADAEITTVEDARRAVAQMHAGDQVPIVIRRGPGVLKLSITSGDGL